MDESQRAAIETALATPVGGTVGAVEYAPGTTLLHRLHPLTKIVLTIGIIVVVFLLSDFRGPLVIAVSLLVVLASLRLVRDVARVAFLISLPLGVSLVVIHGLFFPGNVTPFVAVEPVPVLETVIVWEEGIRFGLLFYFRLLTVIVAVLALIKTTHPRKLSIGLTQKGVPSNLTYVFMAALQLVPQMRDQARAISDAQQARGLDTGANLIERIRAFIALMTPLLIGMLIVAQTRALALESRGFSRTGPRTYLLEVTDTWVDRTLRWGTVVTVAGVVIWQVFL